MGIGAHGPLVALAGQMGTARKQYLHNDLIDEVQKKKLQILDGEYPAKGRDTMQYVMSKYKVCGVR